MDVMFNPSARPIFSMQAARSATSEEKEAKAAGQSLDQMEISQEGRQSTANLNLNGMTMDDFMAQAHQKLGEQKLEVNWNATVDPDGQLWCRAYFDSYVSQITEFRDTAECAIKNYYAGAYQEALNNPLGQDLPSQLNFIAAKYQCSWTDYFDAGMPAGERQWTYTQVRAMLTGTGLRLNDPYALKDIHIPTIEETAQIAKQAADDKISELVRQAKGASGISA